MSRHLFGAAIFLALLAATTTLAKDLPTTWDNLVAVKAKRMDAVYLAPGADFRPYNKIMLDPTEVAFKKNWVQDYNNTVRGLSGRISQRDADSAMERIRTGFFDIFTKAYTDAGWQVVTAPGPDVLRVKTGVFNLSVNAPDIPQAGRVMSFAEQAGEATLFLEARDSQTGALLGRAVDRRIAGNTMTRLRNSVTNRADFRRLFQDWAKESVDGLNELKSQSPVSAGTAAPSAN